MSIINIPIHKRLKEARLLVGISQKQLGIAAGIDEFSSSARMNQYERGKHIPDFLTLKNIAKILTVPVPYFYTEDNILAEIVLMYGQISNESRKKALVYFKAFFI